MLLPLPCVPGLTVFADQAHKSLHFSLGDVLLQQLAVVVQQGGDGVFSQDVITDLTLHHTELLGYVLLEEGRSERVILLFLLYRLYFLSWFGFLV